MPPLTQFPPPALPVHPIPYRIHAPLFEADTGFRLLFPSLIFVPPHQGKNPQREKYSYLPRLAGNSQLKYQSIKGDYAYIWWTAETIDNSCDLATGTFVVQDGKIVAQSFAAKILPKGL